LRIRQQPIRARMCGCGDKDRRAIDPPPIAQLVDAATGADAWAVSAFYVDRTVSSSSTGESAAVSAAVSAVTKTVVVPMPIPTSTRSSPLIGTLVACSMVLHDDQNVRGCFFIFPDLSVRYEGTFVLKLSLISLEGEPMPLLKGETTVASVVYTQPFRVYPPKAFPGMMASSALSRAFARQGCKLPIRRE
ncbi:hypothetical protein CXG81DRAFT_2965, partial [Caulochytrium protostelioides]